MDYLSRTWFLLLAIFSTYLLAAAQNSNSLNGGISAFQALDDLRQIPTGDLGAIIRAMASAVPGRTYPVLSSIPSTAFTCAHVPQVGYYADTETGCQVFRMCLADGTMESFICSNQTLFNQITLVCDWWYNVNCSKSPTYYSFSNPRLYQQNMRFLDDGNSVDIGGSSSSSSSSSSSGQRPGSSGHGIVPASLVLTTARPSGTTAHAVRPRGRSLQTALTRRTFTQPHDANFYGQMTTEGPAENHWPGFDGSTDLYDELTETTDAMHQEASEAHPPSSYSSGSVAHLEGEGLRIQVTAAPARGAQTIARQPNLAQGHVVPGEGGHVQVAPLENPDHATSGSETSEHVIAHETAHVELPSGVHLNISVDHPQSNPTGNSASHAEEPEQHTEEPATAREPHAESGHGEAGHGEPLPEAHAEGSHGISAEGDHQLSGMEEHTEKETATSSHGAEAGHGASPQSSQSSVTAHGHESVAGEASHAVSGHESSPSGPTGEESVSHTDHFGHDVSTQSGQSGVAEHDVSGAQGHAEETGHEVSGQESHSAPASHAATEVGTNNAGHVLSQEGGHSVAEHHEDQATDQPGEASTPEVLTGNHQIASARESSRSPSADRNRAEAAAHAVPDEPHAAPHGAESPSHDTGRNLQVHRPSVGLNPVFRDRTGPVKPSESIPLPGMIFSSNQGPLPVNRVSIVPTTSFARFNAKSTLLTTTPSTTARLTAKRKIFVRVADVTSGKPAIKNSIISVNKEKLYPTRELSTKPETASGSKFFSQTQQDQPAKKKAEEAGRRMAGVMIGHYDIPSTFSDDDSGGSSNNAAAFQSSLRTLPIRAKFAGFH